MGWKNPRRINKHCPLCGMMNATLEKHHIVPRSVGGGNSRDNLIEICRKCHLEIHQRRTYWNAGDIRQAFNKLPHNLKLTALQVLAKRERRK